MSDFPLLKKITFIFGWGIFSYLLSQLLLDVELTQKGLFILLLCAGLWMTEIVPLPVTALLVPVLAYFLGIFEPKSAMAPFASTIIYLFMGGFTLAALLNKHGIDLWLAKRVIKMAKGKLWLSTIGFFGVTSFLSMWMSNTATTAMMIPIAIALIDKQYPRMRTMLILGTAYAANIGGNGTAVGSPPNGIAVAALDLDFITWFKVGFPTLIVMFPLVIFSLWIMIKPENGAKLNQLDDAHMDWTPQAKGSIALFIFTVICWIFSSQIGPFLGVKEFSRMIAILITALAPALGLISWKELESKIGWGILLLFGGGLCLSAVLGATGTSKWLGTALVGSMAGAPNWAIIIACIALMVFLTELSSNTGSAAILIPVMIALSGQFDPAVTYALVFGVGLAANCAFMLPVATPPNALVYGTGYIGQNDMLKTGLILNIFSIFMVFLTVSLFS